MPIGISPCPPFSHRAGLPPGVLWDGNTVAWYKYNDPVAGVARDGANRVSVWLDKYNYAVGASIVPAPNFLNVGWTIIGGAVKIDNDTYTSAGAGDGLRNLNYLWTLNTTYRLRIRIRVTAGVTLFLREASATNTYWTYVGTGAFEDITTYFTVTVITLNGIRTVSSAACQVDVDSWFIEPITGNHLLQYTAANQPTWSAANGVLFDGVNDNLKALAFVLNQPEFIYFVGRQITYTAGDYLFDGNVLGSGGIQQWAVSPGLLPYAGIIAASNNNMPLNTFCIIRNLFNGANSSIQINLTAPLVQNVGANNMGGFTLGARGDTFNNSNIEAKEIIIRRTADNAATQTAIYNYLKTANQVP